MNIERMGLTISTLSLSDYDNTHYRQYSISLKKFMKWRRLMMLFAIIPMATIYCAINMWEFSKEVNEVDLSVDIELLGIILDGAIMVSSIVQLMCSFGSLQYHDKYQMSKIWLLGAFFTPFVILLLSCMIPFERILPRIPPIILNGTVVIDVADIIEVSYIIEILPNIILMIAPSCISMIPAIIRGAIVVKQITDISKEMDFIIKYIPLILIPLIMFFGIIAIQLTSSFFIMSSVIMIVLAFGLPVKIWKKIIIAAVGLMFIVLYLTLGNDGNQIVRNVILAMEWKEICKFIIGFILKYATLSLLASDLLLTFMAYCYEIGETHSSRSLTELQLQTLAGRQRVPLQFDESGNDITWFNT